MNMPPQTCSTLLASGLSFPAKIAAAHRMLSARVPDIDRVSFALYEKERDLLRTHAYSAADGNPLAYHEARLSSSESLSGIVRNRQARIINDLSVLAHVDRKHAKAIRGRGYRSSYTAPIFIKDVFHGFVFLNSYKQGRFDEWTLGLIEPFISIVSLLLAEERELGARLAGATKSALEISKHRDPETGAHLERMARYAQIIAWNHPDKTSMSDDFPDELFRLAPMHDVGKIAIPDRILLKPGKLTKGEFSVMKRHAQKGREIIDRLLTNLQIDSHPSIPMLCNIIEFHHEKMDGSGYPHGLAGHAIPIEARIVAVADIFDALTSERSYKEKWSNEKAFSLLEELSGAGLDPICVRTFIGRQQEIGEIQHLFQDDPEVSPRITPKSIPGH